MFQLLTLVGLILLISTFSVPKVLKKITWLIGKMIIEKFRQYSIWCRFIWIDTGTVSPGPNHRMLIIADYVISSLFFAMTFLVSVSCSLC